MYLNADLLTVPVSAIALEPQHEMYLNIEHPIKSLVLLA